MSRNHFYREEVQSLMRTNGKESEKRLDLINALREDLLVLSIENSNLHLRVVSQVDQQRKYFGISILHGNKIITWSRAYSASTSKVAYDFQKGYGVNTEQFKRKGLITLTSALLCQVLIEAGLSESRGEVWSHNYPSIRSHLNMPDFTRGGFFAHAMFADLENEGLNTLTTYFDLPNIEKPLEMSGLESR